MAKAKKPDRAERHFWGEIASRPGFAARYRAALMELERAARFEVRAKVNRKPE